MPECSALASALPATLPHSHTAKLLFLHHSYGCEWAHNLITAYIGYKQVRARTISCAVLGSFFHLLNTIHLLGMYRLIPTGSAICWGSGGHHITLPLQQLIKQWENDRQRRRPLIVALLLSRSSGALLAQTRLIPLTSLTYQTVTSLIDCLSEHCMPYAYLLHPLKGSFACLRKKVYRWSRNLNLLNM